MSNDSKCCCEGCQSFEKQLKVRSAKRSLKKLKTYIHVNRLRMLSNRKEEVEQHLPVIAVRKGRSGKPRYFRRVHINGPSDVVYDREHPLCVGAEVWVQTDAEVIGEEEVHVAEDDRDRVGGGVGRDTRSDKEPAQDSIMQS